MISIAGFRVYAYIYVSLTFNFFLGFAFFSFFSQKK